MREGAPRRNEMQRKQKEGPLPVSDRGEGPHASGNAAANRCIYGTLPVNGLALTLHPRSGERGDGPYFSPGSTSVIDTVGREVSISTGLVSWAVPMLPTMSAASTRSRKLLGPLDGMSQT